MKSSHVCFPTGLTAYDCMTAEQFLWAVMKSELLYPKRLTFQSENLYYQCMEDCIRAGERTGSDGAQVMQKRKQSMRKTHRVKKKGRGDAVD
mgnify:CR=1 FL=1